MPYDLEDLITGLLGPGHGHGVNRSYNCPFHEDKHPSFSINLTDGPWHCFSCNQSGNYENLRYRLGEPADDDYKIKRAYQDAARQPTEQPNFSSLANSLHRNAQDGEGRRKVIDFLSSRELPVEAIDVFSLGYSQERRAISFPYDHVSGDSVTGIKYRHGDGSKSAETKSTFGLYQPGLAIGRDVVYVGEGESDVISLWSSLPDGTGVCGTSGAGLSSAQWERLAVSFIFSRKVYLVYDADEAGDSCAETAMRVLGDKAVRARPTRGKDFSEHILAGGNMEELIDER